MSGELLEKMAHSEIQNKKYQDTFKIKWAVIAFSFTAPVVAALLLDNIALIRAIAIGSFVSFTLVFLWHRKKTNEYFQSVNKSLGDD